MVSLPVNPDNATTSPVFVAMNTAHRAILAAIQARAPDGLAHHNYALQQACTALGLPTERGLPHGAVSLPDDLPSVVNGLIAQQTHITTRLRKGQHPGKSWGLYHALFLHAHSLSFCTFFTE